MKIILRVSSTLLSLVDCKKEEWLTRLGKKKVKFLEKINGYFI